MRNQKIAVTMFNDILIPISKTIPLATTIIVRGNSGTIETLSLLKQRQYGLFDKPVVLPLVSQPPFSF